MRVAILVLISSWGCAGDGKPGPAAPGETGGDSGNPGRHYPMEVPPVVPDGDVPGVADTDGPELWMLEDDDNAFVYHTERLVVSGAGQVLDDGAGFEGSIDYWYEVDDEVRCDATIAVQGVDDSLTCEGCDFAFKVEAEAVENDSLYTCNLANAWTLMSDGFDVNVHLGFASTWLMYGTYSWPHTYYDVLMAGVGYDYTYLGGDEYKPGPYFQALIFDGSISDRGWADLDENTLSWGYDEGESRVARLNHDLDCGTFPSIETTGNLEGSKVSGGLDCRGTLMDGWAFEAQAGDVVTIAVDAPEADTSFQPYVFVNGPDSCAATKAYINFICTYSAKLGYNAVECASAKLTIEESGDYEIWIRSSGLNCDLVQDSVTYDLYVDRIRHGE